MRLFLSSLCLCVFSSPFNSQNYIRDYHQPSILGHQQILKGDYYKAIEYLEVCVAQEKTFSPELYSLGICYFVAERTEEGKNKIFESYRKGHTSKAIFQDSAFICEYTTLLEYETIKDSCIFLLAKHDSFLKEIYNDTAMKELYMHRITAAKLYSSKKKEMDSIRFDSVLPKLKDSIQLNHQFKINEIINQKGWESVNKIIKGSSFSNLVEILPNNYVESLVEEVYLELQKGNVTPGFYASLYDNLEVRYTGNPKYYSIFLFELNLSESEKEHLKNDCLQIGIGSKEVQYLKYRWYRL